MILYSAYLSTISYFIPHCEAHLLCSLQFSMAFTHCMITTLSHRFLCWLTLRLFPVYFAIANHAVIIVAILSPKHKYKSSPGCDLLGICGVTAEGFIITGFFCLVHEDEPVCTPPTELSRSLLLLQALQPTFQCICQSERDVLSTFS